MIRKYYNHKLQTNSWHPEEEAHNKLHSDQGANFESQIIKELCQITGTIKARATKYHLIGNGTTERCNRTLFNLLGTLIEPQKKDLKKYVSSLGHEYNCTKHETTKVAPFELMFVRKPKFPIDSAFESPTESSYSSSFTSGRFKRQQWRI